MVSLNKLSRMLIRIRGYITIIAYTVVIADVLELIKETLMEWLMHKRFNQLVERHVSEIEEAEQPVEDTGMLVRTSENEESNELTKE